MNIAENIAKIRERITAACARSGRNPDEVRLLAVSKKHTADRIRDLHALGQGAFGENYVQEALAKQALLPDLDIEWHFIGPLQSNKTREAAEHFDWVHSIDRLKLAERLSQQRPESLDDLNVCLQVNIDAEANKSGVPVDGLRELAMRVAELPRIRLRGLMCLPAIRHSFEEQRKPFARLRKLADALADDGIRTDTLSMGMSADFRAAIFENATIVRIGTAIFGARD